MLAPPLKLLRGPSPLWPPSLPTPMMYKSTTVKNHKRRPTLKRSVIKYCGKLKLCLLDLDPNPSPKPLQWFETFYLVMVTSPINGSTLETNKSRIRPMMSQR